MSEKRLLVVDDEPEFCELVRKVAADMGYEVQVATNGHTFQAAYLTLQPTLIVMDMVMPEMDGNELVLWLVEQGYAADLVIITGYSQGRPPTGRIQGFAFSDHPHQADPDRPVARSVEQRRLIEPSSQSTCYV